MASIGGIFNMSGGRISSDTLVKMSKASCRNMRGGRAAVMLGSCGMFWADGGFDSTLAERENIILLCDGEIYPDRGGERAGFFGESDARFCADIYEKYGALSFEHMGGEYAAAILERKKDELVLLRDPTGSRPLFYAEDKGSIGFASEIKSIIAFLDDASVDRKTFTSHVLSRCGQYTGDDLYRSISSVEGGSGISVSGNGTARFDFRGQYARSEGGENEGDAVGGDFVCPDEEGMRRMLWEILYAFDYPQFDCLMPTFLRDCEAAGRGDRCVADGALFFDLSYASERLDRLSAIAGYRPTCTVPHKYLPKERELRKMEDVLRSLLSHSDREKLGYIFETDIVGEINKIENTARRVRSLGMALQSILWYDGYRIRLI